MPLSVVVVSCDVSSKILEHLDSQLRSRFLVKMLACEGIPNDPFSLMKKNESQSSESARADVVVFATSRPITSKLDFFDLFGKYLKLPTNLFVLVKISENSVIEHTYDDLSRELCATLSWQPSDNTDISLLLEDVICHHVSKSENYVLRDELYQPVATETTSIIDISSAPLSESNEDIIRMDLKKDQTHNLSVVDSLNHVVGNSKKESTRVRRTNSMRSSTSHASKRSERRRYHGTFSQFRLYKHSEEGETTPLILRPGYIKPIHVVRTYTGDDSDDEVQETSTPRLPHTTSNVDRTWLHSYQNSLYSGQKGQKENVNLSIQERHESAPSNDHCKKSISSTVPLLVEDKKPPCCGTLSSWLCKHRQHIISIMFILVLVAAVVATLPLTPAPECRTRFVKQLPILSRDMHYDHKWSSAVYVKGELGPRIYGVPDWAASILLVDADRNQVLVNEMTFPDAIEDSWSCGVKSLNGRIYGIPYNADAVLIIDTDTDTIDFSTLVIQQADAQWSTGILAEDGRIFGIPLSATAVLIIDPETNTIDTTTMQGFQPGCCKWSSAILAPNGLIYGIPSDIDSVLIINPNTNVIDQDTISGLPRFLNGWAGGILARNGLIFAIPNSATFVLIVDTTTNLTDMTSVTNLPDAHLKWSSGVIATNDQIYMIPDQADQVLVINPNQGRISFKTLDVPRGSWNMATVDLNGTIYAFPSKDQSPISHHPELLVIDSKTEDVYHIGLPGKVGGWSDCIWGQNGQLYAIPSNANSVLMVDPIELKKCLH